MVINSSVCLSTVVHGCQQVAYGCQQQYMDVNSRIDTYAHGEEQSPACESFKENMHNFLHN